MNYVLIFIFGLIVGSFINVLVMRLNTGRPVLAGRSKCFSCGEKLGVAELIPVFSFFLQKGRCRSCGSKISWQYPLVEFLTGLAFLIVYFRFGFTFQGILFILASIFLIAISVYDLRHKIIPNQFVWPLIALGFLNQLIFAESVSSFFYNLLPGIYFFAFFGLLWLISRGAWLGFGDAKLSLATGWFLGLVQGLAAMLYSFWTGALVGIFLLFWHRPRLTMKHEIPFAPFIVLGFFLSLFLPPFFINW